MKKPFVEHLFTKIIEGKHEKSLSSSAARAVLEHVEGVGEAIRQAQGEEVRQNVLGYREVTRALEQCLDYIENPNTTVTDADNAIYYGYAYNRLREAEEIIDNELSEYEF